MSPGGDIGRLAVFGAVNDLPAAGARPLALALSLVLEEGLPRDTLRRVLESIAAASRIAGVRVVTGDTKVVDRGKGDGIYTSVAGVGVIAAGVDVGPHRIRPGDAARVAMSGATASRSCRSARASTSTRPSRATAHR